jgi:hypothetical protein
MNLVDNYIRLADAWGASMQQGDSKTANRLHDRIQEIFQQLCQRQQEQALFDKADTATDAPCFWIASHLKDRDRSRAIALYQRLARSSEPFVSLSAEYILAELTTQGN